MILHSDESPFIIRQSIQHTLAYADVFDYPLTAAEIHRYLMEVTAPAEAVAQTLANHPDLWEQKDGFYTLPGRSEIVAIRQRRLQNASRLWPYALTFGRLIARLPFVRMIGVTGALAMNNIEGRDDIDYLIVTTPGRLWLTRALVLTYGRIASLYRITLCPNYLISLRALAFTDQTSFTAHELAQMIPLAGMELYDEIRRRNTWMLKFLPNVLDAPRVPVGSARTIPKSLSRPTLETLMQTPPFTWIENWEMDRKIWRLRREQASSIESVFSADVCKGHDQRHQSSTRLALEERLQVLERE
jgi:hypothetical protein